MIEIFTILLPAASPRLAGGGAVPPLAFGVMIGEDSAPTQRKSDARTLDCDIPAVFS